MLIPPRHAENTLENYDPADNALALEAARQFVAGSIRNLLLCGPTGTGKTHLLYGIGRAMTRDASTAIVMERGYEKARTVPAVHPQFWTVPNLCGALRRAAWDHEHDPEPDVTTCPLLLLDDLGADRSTDFVLESLERIINERYTWDRPTAYTSNLDLDALLARYGDRLLSRFAESGRIVTMQGRDRRLERGR